MFRDEYLRFPERSDFGMCFCSNCTTAAAAAAFNLHKLCEVLELATYKKINKK